jgi:hypothetical protein
MDTLERLITELKRDRKERDPSPQRDHFCDSTDASCISPEDPWSRLAQLEARLRSSDTPQDDQSVLTESDYSRGSLSTLNFEFHVDWALVNEELLRRGLPPVLDLESEDGLPTPEAAHKALHSTLREVSRLQRQAESLKSAAEMASQREAAAIQKLRLESQNVSKSEKEWQNLAAKAQEDAAAAKESEMASRHAAKEAAVEAAALKTSLDRLQRQLFAKNSENEALKQQISDHLDKQTQIHLAAKESVKRIRQVFASERVNAGGPLEGSRPSLVIHQHSSSSLSTMNALQVAKVYESQLRAAEEETRAARAETSILREKFEARLSNHPNNNQSISFYTNENNIAAKKVAKAESLAARAEEEAEVLREEVNRRPSAEEYERLQRQTDILTRRLARIEKQRENSASRNGSRTITAGNTNRGAAPSSSFSSSSSHYQQQQQQQLSRQVALEIIESTSTILHCTDIFELPKVARQLQRTLASVPGLQQFVDNVCQAVFRQGVAFVPWSLRQEEPSDVPAIILKWIEMLEEAEELRDKLKQREKDLKIQQNQREQESAKDYDNSKDTAAAASGRNKQIISHPKVITVSRVAAGKGFPEIEIFAPATRPPRQRR